MSVQSVSEVTLSPPVPPSTPTIRITPTPSPPNTTNEEWDSIDDFSVDSFPAEESSSSSALQSPLSPSPPEEIVRDELSVNELFDTPRNSSTDILQKMGHWIYNTRFVQYMKSDERVRVKSTYTTDPIWMLGVCYTFTEDGGAINLPRSDRGGRTSFILNLFGSSEDDEDYTEFARSHGRHRSEEMPRHKLHKTRSFSQLPHGSESQAEILSSNKGKGNSNTGGHAVIRRLRSLSFNRKSTSPPDQKSAVESPSLSLDSRFGSKLFGVAHFRPPSFMAKKTDFLGSTQNETDFAPTPTKAIPIPTLETPQSQQIHQWRKFSMVGQHSQQSLDPSGSGQNSHLQKPRKPRRKTFGSLFGRDKNLSNSAPPLYPHPETDADHDQKFVGFKAEHTRLSYAEGEFRDTLHNEVDDEIYSDSGSESSDTTSRLTEHGTVMDTFTRESISQKDINTQSNYDMVKDIEINKVNPDRTNISLFIRSDLWSSKRTSEGSWGSARSLRSFPVTPTSLYRPDSLGPLTPNQTKLMEFFLDFQSRIFCCYRKDFPPIEPAFHTTDTGWGCMHRTGQSLLAQAFLCTLLGRAWRVHHPRTDSSYSTYQKILSWFTDGPELHQYYSIHNIARMGVFLDKKIGDWFGPSTIAHSLKRLSALHEDCPLVIYVPADNTIYRSEVTSLALGEQNPAIQDRKSTWKPVLILLPVRLGIERLNANYSSNLKVLFELPQFLGIAGGRPCKSLYFVAVQGNELLYLDPHFVRPAINLDEVTDFPIEDYHSVIVRTMDISEMDPSMLLGFLCQSEKDLDDFYDSVKRKMDHHFHFFTMLNSPQSTSPLPTNRDTSIIEEEDDIEDLNHIVMQIKNENDEGVLSTQEDEVSSKDEEIEDLVLEDEDERSEQASVRRQSVLSDDNYELL